MTRRALGEQEHVGPTPERRRHGTIQRFPHSIADVDGRIARPYRVVDTLAAMHAGGSITSEMRLAGEAFRAVWARAHLEVLRAQPFLRMPSGKIILLDDIAATVEGARWRIWRAIQAVGGIASPAGSCLWHVLGLEMTLRDWAKAGAWNNRRIHESAAAGILIAALGALASHWKID